MFVCCWVFFWFETTAYCFTKNQQLVGIVLKKNVILCSVMLQTRHGVLALKWNWFSNIIKVTDKRKMKGYIRTC